MEIVCKGCGKKYIVPDDKIPGTGAVAVTCKSCGYRMTIKREDDQSQSAAATDEAAKKAKPLTDVLSSEVRTKAMEFFRPGIKTALWYCPQSKAANEIAHQLSQLGFEEREVKDRNDLAARLRYHNYDLIVLYQDSHEPEEELKGIMEFINSLSLDERRSVFVVLIHLSGNRVDEMQAFSKGVNLTLNPIDMARLKEILPYEMDKKEAFYKRFCEIKEKVESEGAI